MRLNIKNPEADKLARALAKETGETLTAAVTQALKERLERLRARKKKDAMGNELDAIAKRGAALGKRPCRTSLPR